MAPHFGHLPPLLLFLLLLAVGPSPLAFVAAQPSGKIILGSSLTTQGPKTSWLSSSGDFAFGFRPLESNAALFLLAIWFENTANKTVAWSASLDSPAAAGSTLTLTSGGQLNLVDPSGGIMKPINPTTPAAYAVMQDTGNFMLVAADGTTSWQSFDNPTDTMLPNQTLPFGSQLVSRLEDTDYTAGRFKFVMQQDGNLVAYLIAVPTMQQYSPYWASNTVKQGKQLVFDSSGDIYLESNGSRISIASGGTIEAADYYQRATLDPDGIFRRYAYPKNKTAAKGSFPDGVGWSLVSLPFRPSDICSTLRTDFGSGFCGFNSYCRTGTDNNMTDCYCPPQYSFFDPDRKYKGCKPGFATQSCDEDDSGLYEFEYLSSMDWPLADYEHYNSTSEDGCRALCLSDCFCAVAIFRDGNCWKKRLPMSNGRLDTSDSGKAMIKVRKANLSSPPQPAPTEVVVEKQRKTAIIIGSSLLSSSVLVSVLLLMIFFYYSSKRKHNIRPGTSMSGLSLKSFTYKELNEATKGFKEELGRGAYSTVYKGFLAATGSIAVKKLDKIYEDSEKEFSAEVQSIGQTHHKNLVRLLGFCHDGPSRLLVYEFMSNGSLTEVLFGDKKPEWNQRVRIVLGVARGLLYLHEECSKQIIHCDIKSQNILLDDNLVARISDFGLAKLLGADQTRTNTGIRGTKGYVAPEWFNNRPITAKVDVYSFGVLLLEVICCRKNLLYEQANEESAVLVDWAYDCYREGRLDLLIPEEDEEAMADMTWVERFLMVAIWCIQEDPSLRPSMHKVTQMLEGSVTVLVPPDPSSYIMSSMP